MQLAWQQCQGNVWGPFLTVDLAHAHFNSMEGVYVIWEGNGRVIRVGQGKVKDRLAAHRRDQAITAYNNLYTTWAPVISQYRDGVERYLANVLKPLVGDAFPNAQPIAVNLPWPWQSI
jgi:hypothetical protein